MSRIAVQAPAGLTVSFTASHFLGTRIYRRNNVPCGIVYFVSKARLSGRKNAIRKQRCMTLLQFADDSVRGRSHDREKAFPDHPG